MHWVVFWVLHISNIRYSKVLSVLKTIYCWISSPPIFFKCYKTIHTFYIPEKMHVQSKVTRFMSYYDFSVVGVPSDQVTNRRSKPWRQCCWLLFLSTSLKSVPSSAIRKLFLLLVQVHYPSKTISCEAFGSFGIFFPRWR